MNGLVLARLGAQLRAELTGAVLTDLRSEGPYRYRLLFEAPERRRAVSVSLYPSAPWLGAPPRGKRRKNPPASTFASATARALRGSRLESIEQIGCDRRVGLGFAGGRTLWIELPSGAANLVLVDPRGRIEGAARRPRSARKRLTGGLPYRSPGPPAGRLLPGHHTVDTIDGALARARRDGEDLAVALRKRVIGLGAEGASLVLEGVREGRGSPGRILAEALERILAGELDPVILAPEAPEEAAEAGRFHAERFRLLPWGPAGPPADGLQAFRERDPLGTAGRFHQAQERALAIAGRWRGLATVIRRELRRTGAALQATRRDEEGFRDPERHRRHGEALLAGLSVARRSGGTVQVPDPSAPAGEWLLIPVPGDRSLTAAADDCFRRCRRARRGRDAARRRAALLETRSGSLAALRARAERGAGLAPMRDVEAALRELGIAVGLEPTRAAAEASLAATPGSPRPEAVRLYTSSDGLPILVGKGGRQNQRLTFRLAGPDDFWFHVRGRPGAHVVVRNPGRRARPPDATLREAAAAAAYFSGARGETTAEVQWTRRKYVRRARGAAPGTVLVKRFDSVRVAPAPPPGSES